MFVQLKENEKFNSKAKVPRLSHFTRHNCNFINEHSKKAIHLIYIIIIIIIVVGWFKPLQLQIDSTDNFN